MAQETKKAIVIATGKEVEVYRSKYENIWISYPDCKVKYYENELKF